MLTGSIVALLALTAASTASPLLDLGTTTSRRLVVRQSSSSPTIQVMNGTLGGRYEPTFEQDVFLDIPYAQPPVGNLRLANPQPYNATWNGTRDATAWGNVCPGIGISSTPNATLGQNYVLDEDCLNIKSYGGGFIQGTANDPRYNGSYLVRRSVENGEPVIFASINYRLGSFGFPAGESAAQEDVLNLGLKDQRRALHWVQDNIASFGGAADKVTIWGQSAGGASTTAQLLAYGGRDEGLFRGAIIDSGIFAQQNATLQQPAWSRFLDAAGCAEADDELACLRSLPYADYYSAMLNSSSSAVLPDGSFVRKSAMNAIAAGEIVQVPILVGATRDEATSGIGAPVGLQNETALRTAVAARYSDIISSSPNASIDALVAAYPDDNEIGCPFGTGDGAVSTGLQDKRSNAMWTDSIHAGSRLLAQKHGYAAPVWSWRFHQVPQNSTIDAGAAHANELPYLFRVLERTPRTPLGNRPGDLGLSLMMQDYWLNFVNHLNPNKGAAQDLYWPTYDKSSQNMIFQNNKTRLEKDDYRQEAIQLQIDLALGKA
ncbi:hypothetical protein JCM10213v2_007217 [Rhodosporidiobolus nylandii]